MNGGVIFDLGETLIRFSGDWPEIFDRSLERVVAFLLDEGYQLPAEEFSWTLKQRIVAAQDIREEDFIERPSADVFCQVMADYDFKSIDPDIVDQAMVYLYSESEDHWHPVEGVKDILADIQADGYQMGLISNASDTANVDRLIEKAGVRGFFDPILVSAAVGVRKPAPLIFQRLLHDWNLPAEATVMVGDTLAADIVGARRLGMGTIWLKTAVDRPDNMAWLNRVEPDMAADHLAEVPALLHHWKASQITS